MALNDEMQKIRNHAEKTATKNMKPLLEAYKRSLDNIRKEIAVIIMDYIVDGELKVSRQQRYSILKELERQMVIQAQELGAIDVEVTTNTLSQLYQDSYYMTAYSIEKGIEGTLAFAVVNPELVRAAVFTPIEEEMFSDRIWSNKTKLVQRVRSNVERAIIEGKDPKKLAKDIKSAFGSSTYESTRLIQNEVSRIIRQGQDEIYRQSGVVNKVMFDATLDQKTSKICKDLDGKIFNLGEHPKIPIETHVGCRSDIIPVVDGWKPRKKRENIKNEDGNKQIIDYSSYSNWMKDKGFN